MSETGAVRLWQALESLCASALPTARHLARRLLEHPTLRPWHDDPLKTLDGTYPSLDALAAILQSGDEITDGETIGAIWGALYLPAEGAAVPVRVRAARVASLDGAILATRTLSPEVES